MPELPRVLLSHPGAPAFAQQAARAFHDAGLLACFVTGFIYDAESRLGRGVRAALGPFLVDSERQLARRSIHEIPADRIASHPVPELIRFGAARAGHFAGDLAWEQTERWFDRIVARRHVHEVDVVYAYDHAALRTFEAARSQGILRVYDLPICHHATAARILAPEYARFPEAETAYDRHLRRSSPRRDARKDAELALANLVVVPSGFVRASLEKAGIREDRIAVIPFGAPPALPARASREGQPFVFLSAGSQSVRKGTHLLLEAWRDLAPGPEAELWLVGHRSLPTRLFRDLPGRVLLRESVPREELFQLFDRASLLVLPTLCEGFALVITEAMARGLPVLTTPNSGSDGFVEHGKTGLLVPVGDCAALTRAMQWALDHRDLVDRLGDASLASAHAWTWADYRHGVVAAVERALTGRPTSPRLPPKPDPGNGRGA